MRSYCVSGNCTNTQSSTNGIVNIVGSATSQPSIYEINSGSDATPANQAVKYQMQRASAFGNALGAITPQQINPGAGTAIAAVFTANQSSSALPTYTASAFLLSWGQNQNTAFRWVASGPNRTLQIASTAGAGLGMMPTVVTSAFNAVFSIFVEE